MNHIERVPKTNIAHVFVSFFTQYVDVLERLWLMVPGTCTQDQMDHSTAPTSDKTTPGSRRAWGCGTISPAMALILVLLLPALPALVMGNPAITRQERQVLTCPGFPGYCSESYPGDTCLVVCAFGRNNVPECQDDGTWTDVPRWCRDVSSGEEFCVKQSDIGFEMGIINTYCGLVKS